MPSLGLGSIGAKEKSRTPKVIADHDFDSGTEGFTGSNANISTTSAGLETPCIKVDCTATYGYAYKQYTVTPSTKYYWRIRLATSEVGSGNKRIRWGETQGNSEYAGSGTGIIHNTPHQLGAFISGSFTTGGSITSVWLSLQQQISGKWAGWDDVLLETYDDE